MGLPPLLHAGVSTFARLTTGPPADIRTEMETNYFGTLAVVRAFAPILARNGGGAFRCPGWSWPAPTPT